MVRKGNLAVFKSSNISETGKGMPTKIGVHALDINPYLHEFFRLREKADTNTKLSQVR